MPSLPHPFSKQPLATWIEQLQRSEDPDDRFRAIQAIGFLGTIEDTGRWAARSLSDTDSTVRAIAAKLLGGAGLAISPEAEARLASQLLDIDPDARFEAARTLLRKNSAGQGRAVPILLEFLDEEETQPLMVAAIINALIEADSIEKLTESDLLPRLRRRLADERGEVREAIAIAFAKWPTMCSSVMDELLPLLDDSEPVVREKIAEALGKAGIVNEKITSALNAASQDEDAEVAQAAVQALANLK